MIMLSSISWAFADRKFATIPFFLFLRYWQQKSEHLSLTLFLDTELVLRKKGYDQKKLLI